jgi:flagellar motor protein MotB
MWWLLWACATTHRYPDGTGLEAQLEREIVALRERISDLESGATTSIATGPSPTLAELHQVFTDSPVEVRAAPGGAIAVIPARSLWAEPGSIEPRAEAAMIFDLLAAVLARHPATQVTVVGHTSDRPPPKPKGAKGTSAPTPLEHTARQAVAFAEHLSDAYHIAPERITVSARGAHEPLASNDLPEGQATNERIEVVLIEAAGPVVAE